MQTPRETIYAALFAAAVSAQVNGQPAFVTTSRRWKIWTAVPIDSQPALFQTQRKEHATTRDLRGIAARWELYVDWHVYCSVGGDNTAVASSLLNPILDAVLGQGGKGGVLPYFPVVSTLGLPGIQEARIMEDDVVTDEGVLGSQAVAIIPVRIIAT